jgi:lysyl-tRNA synthetase class 2
MLEWYRAHEPYGALIGDAAQICALAAQAAGSKSFSHRGRSADPFLEPQRMSVCEAFERFAGIDLEATLRADGLNDSEALARAASRIGMPMAPGDEWSDMFSMILAHKVEPNLGLGRMLVLDEYPASEAALARRHPDNPRVCERFELYACGVEIANAFGELTDAAEQRARLEAEMAQRRANRQEDYPLDEDFLAALNTMPDASGIALGADRVLMLASGAGSIEATMWTPLAG